MDDFYKYMGYIGETAKAAATSGMTIGSQCGTKVSETTTTAVSAMSSLLSKDAFNSSMDYVGENAKEAAAYGLTTGSHCAAKVSETATTAVNVMDKALESSLNYVQQSSLSKDAFNSCVDYVGESAKAAATYGLTTGSRYMVKVSDTATTAVNVIDKTIKHGSKVPIMRFDNAHGGYGPHININPRVAKIPADPHIPLPPGGITVAKGTARALKTVNDVALPVAIAVDVFSASGAAYEDYQKGTVHNTVETVSGIAGGWVGGAGGANVGAAVGTAVLPGVGTIVGGIVGAISGTMYGASTAKSVANTVLDAYGYARGNVADEKLIASAAYDGHLKQANEKFYRQPRYEGIFNSFC